MIPTVPPLRLTTLVPAVAVGVPAHVLTTPGVADTTKPAGKVSEKPIPVSATGLAAGFVTVNVSVVDPFKGILPTPKVLLKFGGPATGVMSLAGNGVAEPPPETLALLV